MARFPGFIGAAYESLSQAADVQKCINLYPEQVESGAGQNAYVLYGTPGLLDFCTIPVAAPVRGICGAQVAYGGNVGFLVAVGTKIYFVKYDGTSSSSIMTIADDAAHSPVHFALGVSQIMFAASGTPYLIVTSGATLTPTAIVGLTDAVMIVYLNGYFVAITGSNSMFYFSSLYDGAAWDALDRGTAEYMIDNIMGLQADHNELWLFGDQTIEVWYCSGDADLPFRRIQEAVIQMNCLNRDTIQKVDNSLVWLGAPGNFSGGAAIWQARGYTPRKISTHAIDQALSAYSQAGTGGHATSFEYIDNGHHFYQINFPDAGATWVWDATSGLWHERAYWNGTSYETHLARCHAEPSGSYRIVGTRATTGKLYRMSTDYYDDAGDAIRRARRAPHLRNESDLVSYPGFELLSEVGVGNAGDLNPLVYLRWSNDGGKTFGSGVSRLLGASGANRTRSTWNRLGSARDRVIEVYTTAKVKIALVDAFLTGF